MRGEGGGGLYRGGECGVGVFDRCGDCGSWGQTGAGRAPVREWERAAGGRSKPGRRGPGLRHGTDSRTGYVARRLLQRKDRP